MSTDLTTTPRVFVARKAFFSFLGRVFRIYGTDESLLYYIKRKAFKLKDELNVFRDEGQQDLAMVIQARSIFDFGATFDVSVPGSEPLGACRRQGLKSILRDEWTLLGPGDVPIGKIIEDSMLLALLRRFFFQGLFPQTFSIYDGEEKKGHIKQRWNPFQLAYDVDCSRVVGIDARLVTAATILLLSVEGRQQ